VGVGRVADRPDRSLAGAHLLDVREHLLGQLARRAQRDHRELLVEQRDRAVFHLAGRIPLGVQVGDLFELERTLEGERVEDTAAQVERAARMLQLLGDRVDGAGPVEDGLDVVR
jgi:hypothetical protein